MSLLLVVDAAWLSPYVLTAWATLKEKRLEFQVREISLADGEQRRPEFEPALTGRVPMLVHDGFHLAESGAIVEYLDEAFPETPRLMPVERHERARARQVMQWLRSDLQPLKEARPTSTVFGQPVNEPLPDPAARAADKLRRVAGALVRSASAPGQLFSSFSAADVDLAVNLMRLLCNGDPLGEELAAFARAVWARPSVKSFVDHPRTAR